MTMENLTNSVQHEVQTALMQDRQTRDYAIEVVDNNGVITLKGTVPSSKASERAEAVAREIPGVQSVINELYVRKA